MKKKIIILLLGLVIIITSFLVFKTLKIKNSYNEYVLTNKKTNIYNKETIIGTIDENIYLELEQEKLNNKYYKIKGTDYYIYYKDIKKTEKQEDKNKEYYLEIGKTIKTNNPTNLYQEEKQITLNN